MVAVVDAPIRGFHDENLTVPASNGTKTVFNVRHGFREVGITPTLAVVVALAPRIAQAWFYDASATSKWIDLLGGQNAIVNRQVAGDTSTTLDAMQTGDKIYLGTFEPHGGVFVDMDASAVNGNASTLSLKYSKNDDTFAVQAITDGTASGGATLAQDGNITLDAIPTTWDAVHLRTLLSDVTAPPAVLYWVEFSISAALSADVEVEEFAAFHQDSANVGEKIPAGTLHFIDISTHTGGLEMLS